MEYILQDGEYSYDASEKKITLIPPWDELTKGQIKLIKNGKATIYNSANSIDNITISNGVITHSHGNTGHADSDTLQIIIDTDRNFTDLDLVVFENVILPAGEILTSYWIPIEGIPVVNLYLESILATSWNVEFTDDPAANASGYENCNNTDAVVAYTTVGKGDPIVAGKKHIVLTDIKASQMRIIAKNNGASADIPYCGAK